MRKRARYGWRPDIPDRRDLRFARDPAVTLPPLADLRAHCPPVYDQGDLGSCTANAIAAAIEFERVKQALADFIPSRLFIYYNERRMEGTVNEDAGAEIRDGIKSVNIAGVCPESEWPYDVTRFAAAPPSSCYVDAIKSRVVQYQRLDNRDIVELKSCLAAGYPFVFGFTVYESFEGPTVASTGMVGMPGASESVLGGHAVMAVGYDDAAGRFTVRNSWGSGWGDKGYCYMPYAYLTDPNLADDFWTVRLVSK